LITIWSDGMADPTDQGQNALESIIEGLSQIGDSDAASKQAEQFNGLKDSINGAADPLSRVGNILGGIGRAVSDKTKRSFDDIGDSAGKAGDEIEKTKKVVYSLNSLSAEGIKSTLGNMFGEDFLGQLKSMAVGLADLADKSGSVGEALVSGLAVRGVTAVESLYKKFGDVDYMGRTINEIEENMRGLDKATMAARAGLGAGAVEATANADLDKLRETAAGVMTRSRMSTKEMEEGISGMGKAFKSSEESISIVGDAFTIAKARGMDYKSVIDIITKAKINMGKSAEETKEHLAAVSLAAKDSGRTYEDVLTNIYSNADALKFYGSTMESIVPIFQSFKESLKSIGKEGLTPEMVNKFVGGIKGMDLGQRGLLSMQVPSMSSGGVLGGALQVEKAMETGEGMGDIMKGVAETLKRFGGGRVLTREDALRDPSAQRSYIVQRQMLGQLMKISDPAEQNQMMGLLKDIDKNGVSSTTDVREELNALKTSGETIQQRGLTNVEKATLRVDATVTRQSGEIISSIEKGFRASGFGDVTSTINSFIDEVASGSSLKQAAQSAMSSGHDFGMFLKTTSGVLPEDIKDNPAALTEAHKTLSGSGALDIMTSAEESLKTGGGGKRKEQLEELQKNLDVAGELITEEIGGYNEELKKLKGRLKGAKGAESKDISYKIKKVSGTVEILEAWMGKKYKEFAEKLNEDIAAAEKSIESNGGRDVAIEKNQVAQGVAKPPPKSEGKDGSVNNEFAKDNNDVGNRTVAVPAIRQSLPKTPKLQSSVVLPELRADTHDGVPYSGVGALPLPRTATVQPKEMKVSQEIVVKLEFSELPGGGYEVRTVGDPVASDSVDDVNRLETTARVSAQKRKAE
jgi:hypothetical protein